MLGVDKCRVQRPAEGRVSQAKREDGEPEDEDAGAGGRR